MYAEQGGLTPADSVLGELQVGDVSENNTQINNLRSLQSTLSENGMHIPDQAHAASHRAPSFQASIVPNASAYGDPLRPRISYHVAYRTVVCNYLLDASAPLEAVRRWAYKSL